MDEQVPERKTGIQRVLRACLYTRDGLIQTFKTEAAFRQELALAVVLIPAACYLAKDRPSLAIMIASVMLVLVAELFNSGIEAVVNRFGPEWNSFSKAAKDAGSAAVFIALVNVVAVWGICLL
ncbi:MAG: diacylglycerol kinase [Alphaproteobacteria bacterium]